MSNERERRLQMWWFIKHFTLGVFNMYEATVTVLLMLLQITLTMEKSPKVEQSTSHVSGMPLLAMAMRKEGVGSSQGTANCTKFVLVWVSGSDAASPLFCALVTWKRNDFWPGPGAFLYGHKHSVCQKLGPACWSLTLFLRVRKQFCLIWPLIAPTAIPHLSVNRYFFSSLLAQCFADISYQPWPSDNADQ